MIAALARCNPQDSVNPFVGAAISATAPLALLGLWTAFLWLYGRRPSVRARVDFGRVLHVAIVVAAVVDVVLAPVALWLWVQAHSFIAWCAPVGDAVLDDQSARGDMAFLVGSGIFVVVILLFSLGNFVLALLNFASVKTAHMPSTRGW